MNPERKTKIKKLVYGVVFLILAGVFVYSAVSLIHYFIESKKSQDTYDDLAGLVDQVRPEPQPEQGAPEQDSSEEDAPPAPVWVTVQHPKTGEDVELLPEYAQVYLLNPETVGWLCIPDTNINYPVVQSAPDNVDYYLYRDFYGKYDLHGCLYAREQCDVFAPSDNITIYGHRMNDHTMFGQLAKYEKKEFWQDNQYIYFDTLRERHTYQIVAVFTTTASIGQGFGYHLFVDAQDKGAFNSFMSQCKALSLYDTGITARYGDKLISLSTCEYTHENGRLVVVAKRIG